MDFLRAFFGHLEVDNVALFLEDARDFHLQLGRRHVHLRVARPDRVAHASQHVGDGIDVSCYCSSPQFLSLVSNLLPARLRHAGNLAGQRELAEADAAQRELAEKPRGRPHASSGCGDGTPSFGVLFALAVASFSSLAIFAVVAIRPYPCPELTTVDAARTGTASPSASAAPVPRHRFGPWS